MPRMIK